MINDFTLFDSTNAPVGAGDILDGMQKAWGFVPNPHRVALSKIQD
ncbi:MULTISPECIES: hypothetical protein [unclassified Acidocella]|nr:MULTISPECIES: hypothetical protein [unclassified Acidocella]WBO59068.1 hypothetical protein GT370_18660 [Acidocella sp. MX-AZ03]